VKKLRSEIEAMVLLYVLLCIGVGFILWSSQWARAYFKIDYFNGATSDEMADVEHFLPAYFLLDQSISGKSHCDI